MLELGLAVACCFAMGKIADADGRSAFVWGLNTLVLCLASLAVPFPFLRVLLAGFVAFIGLMVAKARQGR